MRNRMDAMEVDFYEDEDLLSIVVDKSLFLCMSINIVIGASIATYFAVILVLVPFSDVLAVLETVTGFSTAVDFSFENQITFLWYHMIAYTCWAYFCRCWLYRQKFGDDDIDFLFYISCDFFFIYYSLSFIFTLKSSLLTFCWIMGTFRGYWEVYQFQERFMPSSGVLLMPILFFLQAVFVDVIGLHEFPYNEE